MSIRIPLPIVAVIVLGLIFITPVFGQFNDRDNPDQFIQNRDEAAIRDLLEKYVAAFNTRDIDWRMSLCLDTYHEYGFDNGIFLQVRDYDETRREVGRYWSSIDNLDYSIDEIDITLDGPLAFVRAHTTHLARDERHGSIVHFALVKINGVWRITWNSYNIVTRFD